MKRWASVTSGADWTAITSAMNALQALHESTCYLEAVPDGGPLVGSLTIRCLLQRRVPGPSLATREVGVAGEWPNKDGTSLEVFLLGLLVSLDELALKEWWVQNQLMP